MTSGEESLLAKMLPGGNLNPWAKSAKARFRKVSRILFTDILAGFIFTTLSVCLRKEPTVVWKRYSFNIGLRSKKKFCFSDGSCWEIIIIKQIHTFTSSILF